MGRTVTAMELARKVHPELDTDHLLGLFSCRNIRIGDELVTDPRIKVPSGSDIFIEEADSFVSRGGLKLEHALSQFGIDVSGKIVLDAGASTGGFTDCLLKHGARAVHSVDVGYNQLDYSLRKDSRVIVHERQNIMTLSELDPPADFAVADLSFRSISGAASHIISLVSDGFLIALIKPQFEVPRWEADFDGVVKDSALLRKVMISVRETLEKDDSGIRKLTVSPIRGHKGNAEFLALLEKGPGLSESEYSSVLDSLLASL
ncbi:MAG: TlyA family RNA methyltransferase [Sphaerochaetaceae bacterium]|jgi:23S rRNA (cytidine1920-2'-O)/16S rRNA (cytidine1409-2'-O)-methyltransferase